jgi:hypothetical protein
MRHEQIGKAETYEKVDPASILATRAQPQAPFRSAAAAPDIPAAVGRMIVAAYTALLGTFAITMAHSRDMLFAMAICAVFLTMYLTIPRIFLGVEPKQGERPTLDLFLYKGMDTYTGHCNGKAALAQILIIPVLLTLCALVMGIIALSN